MNKFNKFNSIYKNILSEASKEDKEFQKEKLDEFITEKYYELKDEILNKIFSDDAEHCAGNQLDYFVLNDEMVDKKFGKILYSADDTDNFDEFEFTENDKKRITQMIYKCLIKNFKSIFIDHEDY